MDSFPAPKLYDSVAFSPCGNFSVNPIPYLETKFVAANPLIAMKRPKGLARPAGPSV